MAGSTRIDNAASETGHYYGLWHMLEPLLEETVTFEVMIGDMIIIDKGRSTTKGMRLLNFNQLFSPSSCELQAGKVS